jgi:hypothetical protein
MRLLRSSFRDDLAMTCVVSESDLLRYFLERSGVKDGEDDKRDQ